MWRLQQENALWMKDLVAMFKKREDSMMDFFADTCPTKKMRTLFDWYRKFFGCDFD